MTERPVPAASNPPLNSADYSFQRRTSQSTSPRRPSATLSDSFPTDPNTRRGPPRGRKPWHHRPQSPGLKWHKDYKELDPKCGRLLIIDFVKQDHSKAGMRKVAAQEINDLEGLRKIYASPDRGGEAILRVFHVQNAYWATRFLLRKFSIDNRDNLVGTDFGKYVLKRPERRGGKPFLSGKSWPTQHDPWRGITKTSFGIDYLKDYRVRDPLLEDRNEEADKVMELNCFDDNDEPSYGYDVYVQRLSCYVQHKEVVPEVPTDPDIENPYAGNGYGSSLHRKHGEYIPHLNTLDNGNAIIIFDNAHSGSIADTLIAARQEWESRWRRLPFYLAYESGLGVVENDDRMALECAKIIMSDIFKGVVVNWEGLLDIATTHVGILEDKIYEQPADETRAPELWTNSSQWLKVEKLMFIHIDIVKDMKARLKEIAEDVETSDKEETWLEDIPGDFDRLSNLVAEDLVKPTESLISLLYQSVSIRDSRHSLQLGTSMWRLSWITFIFLPLTFMVGFFGMNVDTFANDPSIKWYFIAAVPFMLLVLAMWYFLKHLLEKQRQTPYQRGIYESFFHGMAVSNPTLWSRTGPRDYVVPTSRLGKLKWYLIRRWNAPEVTIRAGNSNQEAGAVPDDLGSWSKLKRHWIKKWTGQIQISQKDDPEDQPALSEGDELSDLGPVADGIVEASKLAAAPTTASFVEDLPAAAGERLPGGTLGSPLSNPRIRIERQLSPARSRGSSGNRRSGSEGRNSGILVEEEDSRWLMERGKEGKGWWRRSEEREREKERRRSGEQERRRSSDERARSPVPPPAGTTRTVVGSDENSRPQRRGGKGLQPIESKEDVDEGGENGGSSSLGGMHSS